MTTPENFLRDARARFRSVPDSVLAQCNAAEAESIRSFESNAIEMEFLALCDIVMNCRNRFQFAKTYKTLRADLAKTLATGANSKLPPHMAAAMKAVFENVIRRKLSEMASWFFINFSDDHDMRLFQRAGASRVEDVIEIYAGKEGQSSGCAGVLLLGTLVTFLVGVSLWRLA